MKQHIAFVAALNIGFGLLKLLFAVIVLVAVVGGGLISGDSEAMVITGIVGPVVASVLVLLALPGIIGGIGLLKGKPWARILIIILSVLGLSEFPLGTAVGLYTLWVLLHGETGRYFGAEAKQFGGLAPA